MPSRLPILCRYSSYAALSRDVSPIINGSRSHLGGIWFSAIKLNLLLLHNRKIITSTQRYDHFHPQARKANLWAKILGRGTIRRNGLLVQNNETSQLNQGSHLQHLRGSASWSSNSKYCSSRVIRGWGCHIKVAGWTNYSGETRKLRWDGTAT